MTDNITKLRNVQLELLQAFTEVCEARGLRYYAFFGTLIGVMRQEGYLTWDDDIDLAMPEADYKTLCTHAEWFDDRFFLQTPLDEGAWPYAKLRRNGTTLFYGSFVEGLRRGGHMGISLDIIPLQEIPGMEAYHTPVLSSHNKKTAVYPKSWFEPAASGIFENIPVRIPAAPRRVLQEVYGDWGWPSGAQAPVISNWFFDTERGYEHYVRRYTGMLEDVAGKKIYLFGAADSLRIWLERFALRKQVVCTFDNDPAKWGEEAFGVAVRSPEELPVPMDADSRLIICSVWHAEIGRQLERKGITDYYVYLDDYYDEKIGRLVMRREDSAEAAKRLPRWEESR